MSFSNSAEIVLSQLLTERGAVDSEPLRGESSIAVAVCHDGLQEGRLNDGEEAFIEFLGGFV